MVFIAFDNVFMSHIFSEGSRLSTPSWKDRRYGLTETLFLTCLLMLVRRGRMSWIFEHVATYVKACSLLPPREPFSWSWTCMPAALGDEEASCMLRQALAVDFGSGELLLLSYC